MEKKKESRGERLKQFILSQIEEKGPVPFSQFMEWCLYHPDDGYYQSDDIRIGKEGDYYTGPCVHPLFGGMIAKQLLQMAEILGEESFEVVEMGGGQGFLCQDILGWMEQRAPHLFEKIRYSLLETGPHLLKEQKERLQEYEKTGKVSWMDPIVFEEGKKQITGCFLSNELVDAFPVHQVVFDQGNLKEIYVTQLRGQLKEQLEELSNPEIASTLRSMAITLQEGQRAEVNLKALDWMERVGRLLEKGFVLTIDYGYLAPELYAPPRHRGTLLCYYHHQISENPYERIGEQDITSHVNFTGLIKKGEELGLHLAGLVPQYRFLIALGILQEMELLNQERSELDKLRLRLSILHLIEPESGMGEMFKVLVQYKGIPMPHLDGLRDLNTIPWPDTGKKTEGSL